jgi:hypothetical protein
MAGCARTHSESARQDVKTLRVLPEAEVELAEAAEWYESKRVDWASSWLQRWIVLSTISRTLPCRTPWRADRPYRRKVLTRFPYLVFFRVEGDAIEIMAPRSSGVSVEDALRPGWSALSVDRIGSGPREWRPDFDARLGHFHVDGRRTNGTGLT